MPVRVQLTNGDRLFVIQQSRSFPLVFTAITITGPETLLRCHRAGFAGTGCLRDLVKDCPEPRPIHPPTAGNIIAFPEVGGLHHRYERRAA